MNNSKSEPDEIRRPSSNCFSGIPTKSKRKAAKENGPEVFGPFLPRPRPARYDDFASDSLATALKNTFVGSNADQPSGNWVTPTANHELDAIYRTVNSGRTYGGAPFPRALAINKRVLLVGIVDIDQTRIMEVSIEADKGFLYERTTLQCHPVNVLLAAPAGGMVPPTCLPLTRWKIAKRKFGLPKGRNSTGSNFVSGPYLAVAVYEPTSKVIARIRLFPIWYSSAMNRMMVVRSGLERIVAAAFAAVGAVAFSPVSKRQFLAIQDGLGHRWTGDLGSYSYHPDFIVMPADSKMPIVVEVFGVRSMEPYNESKRRKKAEGSRNPNIRFVFLEGSKLAPSDVEIWVAKLLANPANGIWLKRSDGPSQSGT